VRKRIHQTRELARADFFDYIEVFYDRTRFHSHLGGVGPEVFEQAASRGAGVSTIPSEVHQVEQDQWTALHSA